ncbi:restriction endonuclease subunit S [Glaesserella parasuis]|nr:restriction endonuclease subunit S [Glaesserella parasuis]
MSSWKKVTLEDISESINTGLDAIRRAPIVDFETDIKCLRIQDISQNKPIESWGFTEVKNTDYSKFRLMKDDIIMARTCSTGICFLAKQDLPAVFNNGLARIRLKKDIAYPTYVYYVFKSKSFISYIDGISGGTSVQLNMKIGDLSKYSFDLPPLNIQKEIANKLSDLDKKIQLNTQINQTLEQIAQTIFKSWFIDFDPVHAKANALANGQTTEQATQAAMTVISGKNTQELHRLQTANPEQYQQLWEIAEAFPSGFDEEGVPWGWEEKSFGELLENTIGGDWGKDEVDEKHTEKVSILRGTDLPDVYKGNDKDVPTRFVEQKKLKSRKLQHSDIVIEVSGGSKNQPTGRSLLITDKLLSRFNNPIVPASFCRLFRPKSENYGYLLALHLQIIYQQGKTWEYQNQSTGISNFQTTHFLETEKVILPTNKTLMYFAEMVYPIFDKIYSNENQKLTEIRDELLPKLLSGEILNGN